MQERTPAERNKSAIALLRAQHKEEIVTSALLETMKLILRSVKYLGRSRTLDFTANPDIVISGDRELKIMLKQEEEFGVPLS